MGGGVKKTKKYGGGGVGRRKNTGRWGGEVDIKYGVGVRKTKNTGGLEDEEEDGGKKYRGGKEDKKYRMG